MIPTPSSYHLLLAPWYNGEVTDPVALFAALQRGHLRAAQTLCASPGCWPDVWAHVAWLSGAGERPPERFSNAQFSKELLSQDRSSDGAVAFRAVADGTAAHGTAAPGTAALGTAADGVEDPAWGPLRRYQALGCVLASDATLLTAVITPGPASELVRAWQALMAGEAPPEVPRGEEADAAAVGIERVCLRALHALAIGDMEEARVASRRAFRMARTEGYPLSQYLAGIVLARYRRLSGTPHLALRILRGLGRVTPSPWRGWLAWEGVLSGGVAAAQIEGLVPPTGSLAAILVQLLEAAQTGNRSAFGAAATELQQRAIFAPFRQDIERVIGALDPHHPMDRSHPCFSFRTAQVPVPFGLDGLSAGDEEMPRAAVCLQPSAPPIRVLWLGAPLFDGVAPCEQARARDRTGRTEAALVKAGLAGPTGIEETQFFRELYGFDYDRGIHRGVLGVLVHRMRAWLGDDATLQRDERIALHPASPFVVPDSSVSQSVLDRVLLFLSRHEAGTARETGAALGLSLRNVQLTLSDLVERGVCHRSREGRRVTYLLEDTTFQDPTVI